MAGKQELDLKTDLQVMIDGLPAAMLGLSETESETGKDIAKPTRIQRGLEDYIGLHTLIGLKVANRSNFVISDPLLGLNPPITISMYDLMNPNTQKDIPEKVATLAVTPKNYIVIGENRANLTRMLVEVIPGQKPDLFDTSMFALIQKWFVDLYGPSVFLLNTEKQALHNKLDQAMVDSLSDKKSFIREWVGFGLSFLTTETGKNPTGKLEIDALLANLMMNLQRSPKIDHCKGNKTLSPIEEALTKSSNFLQTKT